MVVNGAHTIEGDEVVLGTVTTVVSYADVVLFYAPVEPVTETTTILISQCYIGNPGNLNISLVRVIEGLGGEALGESIQYACGIDVVVNSTQVTLYVGDTYEIRISYPPDNSFKFGVLVSDTSVTELDTGESIEGIYTANSGILNLNFDVTLNTYNSYIVHICATTIFLNLSHHIYQAYDHAISEQFNITVDGHVQYAEYQIIDTHGVHCRDQFYVLQPEVHRIAITSLGHSTYIAYSFEVIVDDEQCNYFYCLGQQPNGLSFTRNEFDPNQIVEFNIQKLVGDFDGDTISVGGTVDIIRTILYYEISSLESSDFDNRVSVYDMAKNVLTDYDTAVLARVLYDDGEVVGSITQSEWELGIYIFVILDTIESTGDFVVTLYEDGVERTDLFPTEPPGVPPPPQTVDILDDTLPPDTPEVTIRGNCTAACITGDHPNLKTVHLDNFTGDVRPGTFPPDVTSVTFNCLFGDIYAAIEHIHIDCVYSGRVYTTSAGVSAKCIVYENDLIKITDCNCVFAKCGTRINRGMYTGLYVIIGVVVAIVVGVVIFLIYRYLFRGAV